MTLILKQRPTQILKIFLCLNLLFSQCVLNWKPIIIGHRGGDIGVENTAEAFKNAADIFHFEGIECDIRLTKDKKFVISHNSAIVGDKGEMEISNTTLAELKSNLLTEVKNGNTYIGRICTLEEFLAIAKEKNLIPMIEIKEGPGFDTPDMPEFPKLEKIVRDFGLSEKVIYSSFYDKAVEYIKENYPQYTVHFLIFNLYEAQFEWLKKWKITPSINCDYLTYERYNLMLSTGVKDIACWNLNYVSLYDKLSNIGIHMMVADFLSPDQLKEYPFKPKLNFIPFYLVSIDVVKEFWFEHKSVFFFLIFTFVLSFTAFKVIKKKKKKKKFNKQFHREFKPVPFCREYKNDIEYFRYSTINE